MLLLGHLGFGKLLAEPVMKKYSSKNLSILWVLGGCVLPDFFDKLLFYFFGDVHGTISGTRTFGHSLLFLGLVLLWGQLDKGSTRKKALLALALGMATHILIDHALDWIVGAVECQCWMVKDYGIDSARLAGLLWTLLGNRFPVFPFHSASDHVLSNFSKYHLVAAEILGTAILLFDVRNMRDAVLAELTSWKSSVK